MVIIESANLVTSFFEQGHDRSLVDYIVIGMPMWGWLVFGALFAFLLKTKKPWAKTGAFVLFLWAMFSPLGGSPLDRSQQHYVAAGLVLAEPHWDLLPHPSWDEDAKESWEEEMSQLLLYSMTGFLPSDSHGGGVMAPEDWTTVWNCPGSFRSCDVCTTPAKYLFNFLKGY